VTKLGSVQDRRAAYEAEQARIRYEKAVEIDRLRARQERADDVREQQDALRAKRAQEQTEREWRKKEEMQAVQKAQNEEMLKKARIKQQEEKEHLLGIEAQRDRADFERMLKLVSLNSTYRVLFSPTSIGHKAIRKLEKYRCIYAHTTIDRLHTNVIHT